MPKFTKPEYEKLADRFNKLPLPDQIQRVIDNPEILEMTITFRFKGVTQEESEELITNLNP